MKDLIFEKVVANPMTARIMLDILIERGLEIKGLGRQPTESEIKEILRQVYAELKRRERAQ